MLLAGRFEAFGGCVPCAAAHSGLPPSRVRRAACGPRRLPTPAPLHAGAVSRGPGWQAQVAPTRKLGDPWEVQSRCLAPACLLTFSGLAPVAKLHVFLPL